MNTRGHTQILGKMKNTYSKVKQRPLQILGWAGYLDWPWDFSFWFFIFMTFIKHFASTWLTGWTSSGATILGVQRECHRLQVVGNPPAPRASTPFFPTQRSKSKSKWYGLMLWSQTWLHCNMDKQFQSPSWEILISIHDSMAVAPQ